MRISRILGDGGQRSGYLQGVQTAEAGRREPSGVKDTVRIFSGVGVCRCICMYIFTQL